MLFDIVASELIGVFFITLLVSCVNLQIACCPGSCVAIGCFTNSCLAVVWIYMVCRCCNIWMCVVTCMYVLCDSSVINLVCVPTDISCGCSTSMSYFVLSCSSCHSCIFLSVELSNH